MVWLPAVIRATYFRICVHQEGDDDYYPHQMIANFMLIDPPLNQFLGSKECDILIGLNQELPETTTMEG